ncbi:cell adhesion molecule-like protein [Leptotrombidium deliense]|uniref:Cell adhesion molecule-like protein n=1 Tax=Leptotrombidium deliense TaxID=299467 RepID=A0A443SUZ7_9ACAR|nr:cell adhesion molecule-like protein [Leptotrombidium deliense]
MSLKCSASGSPLPEIRWYRYNKLLTDTNYRRRTRFGDYVTDNGLISSHLNVSSVTVEDGGLYTCEAFNEIGSTRHSAAIHVFGAPFVHKIDNITLVTTAKVHIDCPYSGFPIESVTWKKGENEIIITASVLIDHPFPFFAALFTADGKELLSYRRMKAHKNGTLVIVDIRPEDEGCMLFSLYYIITEKPAINPFLFGSDLREGMRTTVVCSVSSGEPPFKISWFKDGQPLRSIHPEIEIIGYGDYTSSLTIKVIERKHTGNYTCKVASANIDSIFSTFTTQLQVQASPKWILKPLSTYTVMKGRKLTVHCQGEGIPTPTHQWKKAYRKGGNAAPELIGIVSGPHIYVLENGSLVIIDANKEDEGDYVCDISNGIGSSLSSTSSVRVNYPSHFTKNFEVITVREGLKAELICDVIGDKPINVSWFKDKIEITSNALSLSSPAKYAIDENISLTGITSRLVINRVDVSDSTLFACRASNPFGNDEKNIQVVVQGPPDSPSNIKTVEVLSREATLSWSEPRSGNSALLGFVVEYISLNGSWQRDKRLIHVPAKDKSVIIKGFYPDETYKIRVIAQNAFGDSEPSDELLVITDEEAPTEIPTNVRIESITSNTLRVEWKYVSFSQKVIGFNVGHREISHYALHKSSEMYTFKTVKLQTDTKTRETFHFTIIALKKNTKYGIIIQAFNRKGLGPSSDEVIAETLEFDPPESVNPRVTDVSQNSLSLIWENDGQNPISGFTINYKSDSGDWEEQKVLGSQSSYTVENLRCGTKYQVTMTAYNKAGRAPASDVITAFTAGSVPSAPTLDSLIGINSTFVFLRLSAWKDNGCPIISFVVQYKINAHLNWIMLSNNIIPEQGHILIPDLVPATWYDLIMTAHSEAGYSEAQYLFATLTLDGGKLASLSMFCSLFAVCSLATIPPPSAVVDTTWDLIISDPFVVIPVSCTILVAIIIIIVILFTSFRGFNSDANANGDQMMPNENCKCVDACPQALQCISEMTDENEGTHKCDILTLSSFSTKAETGNESFPNNYASCRSVEPKFVFETAMKGNDAKYFTGTHQMHSCDHVYDLPQRPVAVHEEVSAM